MSHDPDRFEHVEVHSADALWQWMAWHFAQEEAIWLVTWKAAHAEKYVSRDAVLDVLVAYGWVDGRRMKLDEDRTMQLLAPRKAQTWAQSYKDRAERLEAEGLMQEPGRAAIARAKTAGKWNAMAHVDALKEPADLVDALLARKAKSWWDSAAASYRRNILRWIAGAKRDETRAKRILTVCDHAERGEKVPHY